MIIDFQQGIVTYPTAGTAQAFLSRSSNYVDLSVDNGRIDVAFLHGTENYFHTESENVGHAWGPLEASTDYWLYWDIDLRTAQRTFGVTTLQPVYSTVQPVGQEGLHWFNTATRKMSVFTGGRFRECVRVFAAKVNNATFIPLGSLSSKPFAGSQVGLNAPDTLAGRILIDTNGKPIKRADGSFFTSESKFFFNGTPINTVRLESSIIQATAAQNVSTFQVVALSDFEEVRVAEYEDLQTAAVALCLTDALTGDVVELCVQGMVTNPSWNWTEVGVPLWINDAGDLTSVDPHIADPIAHSEGKSPIARVFSATSVYFDQGLGGKGERGQSVQSIIPPAGTSIMGAVRVSVPPMDAVQPIAVGTNDPRMTNARVPTTHTQPASSILTPINGALTGTTLDVQLGQVVTLISQKHTALAELDDVTMSSIQDNQVLRYHANTSKWVNDTLFSKSIVWKQVPTSASWAVQHNQNNLYPVISVFTASGVMIDPSLLTVTVVDANNITIARTDNASFAGRAHIVFVDPANVIEVIPAGDTTSPTIAPQSVTYLCKVSGGNVPIGTITATDDTSIAAFHFTTTNTAISTDGYFQIDADGTVRLTATGFANLPVSGTYSVKASDPAGNWSTPATMTFTVPGVPAIIDSYWAVSGTPDVYLTPAATEYGGITYAAADKGVGVLNDDGTPQWGAAISSPTRGAGGMYIYNTDVICGTLLASLESYNSGPGGEGALIAIDTAGNQIVWQKSFTNAVNTSYGGFVKTDGVYAYVACYTEVLNPGSDGTASVVSLLKFDKTGQLLWQKAYAFDVGLYPEMNNSMIAVQSATHPQDPGAVFLMTQDNHNGQIAIVAKINPSTGTPIWASQINLTPNTISVMSGSGDVVLGTSTTGSGPAVIVLSHTDGSTVWSVGLPQSVNVYSVQVDSLDNIYVAADINGGLVIHKFDSTGARLWANSMTSSAPETFFNNMSVRNEVVYYTGAMTGHTYVASLPADGTQPSVTEIAPGVLITYQDASAATDYNDGASLFTNTTASITTDVNNLVLVVGDYVLEAPTLTLGTPHPLGYTIPPITTDTVLDQFSGTDGTTLDAHTLDVGGTWMRGRSGVQSDLGIIGNRAGYLSFHNNADVGVFAAWQMSSHDYYVEADIILPSNPGRNQFSLYGRLQAQPQPATASLAQCNDVTFDFWPSINEIRANQNGQGGPLTSTPMGAYASGAKTVRVEFVGTTGTVKINGATVLTFTTNPGNTVNGWVGFGIHFYDSDGSGPGILVDAFRAGLIVPVA